MLLLCIMPFSFFSTRPIRIALSPPIAHQSRLRPQQQMVVGGGRGRSCVGITTGRTRAFAVNPLSRLAPPRLSARSRRDRSDRSVGIDCLFHLRRGPSSTIFSPTSTLRRPGAAGMSTCASTPRSSCTIPRGNPRRSPPPHHIYQCCACGPFPCVCAACLETARSRYCPFHNLTDRCPRGVHLGLTRTLLLPAVGVYFVAGALLTQPRWSGWPRDCLIVGSTLLLSLLAVLYGHAFWVV